MLSFINHLYINDIKTSVMKKGAQDKKPMELLQLIVSENFLLHFPHGSSITYIRHFDKYIVFWQLGFNFPR